MNNIRENKSQKIAGVFETEEGADIFVERLKRSDNTPLSPNNCQIKKYQAIKDQKLLQGTIKENDYIVVIEGTKEDLDKIGEKITFDSSGSYLAPEQMNSLKLTNDFVLELPLKLLSISKPNRQDKNKNVFTTG